MNRISTAMMFFVALGCFAVPSAAAPVQPPAERVIDDPPAERGLQIQDLDDPALPLKAARPRSLEDEARLDAMAWFGAGRVLQDRGDSAGALRAYRKALERDPTAVVVYRVAIPLAIEMRQNDDAARWVMKAVELAPSDLPLLLQAVQVMIGREDLSGAIQLLELALKTPALDRTTPQYVFIMRDLAILYSAADRKDDAVAGFEVLFDALTNPDKYKLDNRTRTQLQNNPATSYEKLGQVFLDAKKTDLALAAFQKAAESRRGSAPGNLSFNLAQVYLQAGQAEKALEEIDKYIDSQRQSKGRAAYELLGAIMEKLNKPQGLIARLEEAAGKDPRNSTLQYFLAEQYAGANRLDDAETLFKKTLESAAEAQGYVGLAGVYRRQRRPSELIEALGKGYAEAGDLKGMKVEFKAIVGDEKLLASLLEAGAKRLAGQAPPLDWASGYVLANLAADGKQTDSVERLYRHLLTLRREKAQTIYEELANHLSDVRKYAAAAKVYQEAVDDPGLADVRPNFLFLQTHALGLAGETKKALEAINAAQQLIPNNPLLRSQEAWVYYHSHQFDEAIERYEKLITDFPQSRQIIRRAQYSLSNIHVLKGDVRKGLEILEAIYKDEPNDVSVNNDLGYLYADHGMHLEQAEGMIRKALAAEPENAAYLDSMGWVLFKLGKAEEALPYLEKAITISTGSGDETLYDHLADIYDRLKQPGKAADAWRKSLDLAKEAAFPDRALIERVEEKLKTRKQEPGQLKPQQPGAP